MKTATLAGHRSEPRLRVGIPCGQPSSPASSPRRARNPNAAGVLVSAIGVTVANIILATFRQAYCPPGMLGRVTATMRFVIMGTSPFGALAGGALGTWLGPRDALWVVLSILAVSGTPLLSRHFTRHRDLPAATARPASEPARAERLDG